MKGLNLLNNIQPNHPFLYHHEAYQHHFVNEKCVNNFAYNSKNHQETQTMY